MAEYFPWKDEYKIGVEVIDKQHEHFVSLMNKLYFSIFEMAPQAANVAIVDELAEYTKLHFSTEEKYFKEFKYEEMAEHLEDHRRLRAQVDEFQRIAKETGKVESFALVNFLHGWLIDHIYTDDKKYVKCFHDHGLK